MQARELKRGEQLAFIVGHYKSGSTWLANLLSLHPEIVGLRETHLFRYSATSEDLRECTAQIFATVAWAAGGRRNLLRHRVGNLVRPFRTKGQATLNWRERPTTLLDLSLRDQIRLQHWLLASGDADEYRRRFYGFLFQALRPGRYLLDKTSTNIFFVPDIRRQFPLAKLVAIYRDGRDVVVSDKYHLANEYKRQQIFHQSTLAWRKAMEAQLEYAQRYGVATVAYEELLARGPEVAQRVLDLLELPTDRSTLDDMLERSSFRFVTGRDVGTEDRSAFYRKGGTGGWREHFGDEQRRTFSELAGDLLVRLGYESEADWRRWS